MPLVISTELWMKLNIVEVPLKKKRGPLKVLLSLDSLEMRWEMTVERVKEIVYLN